jgi:hypothetical protein
MWYSQQPSGWWARGRLEGYSRDPRESGACRPRRGSSMTLRLSVTGHSSGVTGTVRCNGG